MELSGHIKVDKELAVKGYVNAFRFSGLINLASYYGTRLAVVWVIVAMADGIAGERDLAPLHALALAIVWLGVTSYEYVQWRLRLKADTVGWEFDATLNETGVKTYAKAESEKEYPWDFYTACREYEDYLEIRDSDGNVTFVPKTLELAELVAFTKEKIPTRRDKEHGRAATE